MRKYLLIAPLFASASLAYAALPQDVTDAVTSAQSDVASMGALGLALFVGAAVFGYMKFALK